MHQNILAPKLRKRALARAPRAYVASATDGSQAERCGPLRPPDARLPRLERRAGRGVRAVEPPNRRRAVLRRVPPTVAAAVARLPDAPAAREVDWVSHALPISDRERGGLSDRGDGPVGGARERRPSGDGVHRVLAPTPRVCTHAVLSPQRMLVVRAAATTVSDVPKRRANVPTRVRSVSGASRRPSGPG